MNVRTLAASATLILATAAPSVTDAQTTTLYGCGTFSCHTATFTVAQIAPTNAYGRIWTESLQINWKHVFTGAGGHFGDQIEGPHFIYRDPIADLGIWQFVWSSDSRFSSHCVVVCVGTRNDYFEGFVDPGYSITSARTVAFAGPRSPFFEDEKNRVRETINMQAVPEPATWALMAGGLGVLGTVARRRKLAPAPAQATC